jgi:hypothetical protein
MKPTSLQGIANRAASDKAFRFRNLFGMLTAEFFLCCWQFVNKRAASGVDRQDARSCQENLGENIEALVAAVEVDIRGFFDPLPYTKVFRSSSGMLGDEQIQTTEAASPTGVALVCTDGKTR